MRLHAVDAATIGEQQQLVVGVADDQARGSLDILRGGAAVAALGDALDADAAATLRAERVNRLALDVAVPCERHHRGLVGHQVGFAELLDAVVEDLGLALGAVGLDQFVEVFDDHGVDLLRVGEQAFEVFDRLDQVLVLLLEAGALERGEAAQLHVEHGLGLALGELEGIFLQRVAGGVGRVGGANRGDDLVDHVDRFEQALDDVVPIACLLEIELGAPGEDDAAVIDERRDHLEQVEGARPQARFVVVLRRQRDEVGVVPHLQVG